MRRCIRALLLTVTLLTTLQSTATANHCCLLPLLCPLNWCGALGHQNPYATRQIIDDWLGYGYLRGNANGSLGHYPMKPWNTYAPAYPALARPMGPAWGMPAPRYLPNPYPVLPPAWTAPAPAYFPMQPQMPFLAQGGDCGCGAPAQPVPMPMPTTNCLPECDPCQQYSPQHSYPMSVPQFQSTPMQAPCNDCGGGASTMAPGSSAYYQNSAPQMMAMPPVMTAPAMTAWSPTSAWSPGNVWNGGATSAARPQMHAVPFSQFQQRRVPQIAGAYAPMTGYAPPAMAYGPQTAAVAYQPQPTITAWNQVPQTSPYFGGQMASPRVAADYLGDHEYPSTQIQPVPMTGSLPVMQNSFSGSVPLVRTGYAPSPGLSPPLRTTSLRKYSASVR